MNHQLISAIRVAEYMGQSALFDMLHQKVLDEQRLQIPSLIFLALRTKEPPPTIAAEHVKALEELGAVSHHF